MAENADTHTETIENASLDDVRPGDHLTWARTKVLGGVTSTESHKGIAHHHDGDGDWITKDGVWITDGARQGFTLTIRRPVRELPTEGGAVIVANYGHEYITATVFGVEYRAREAVLVGGDTWYAAWRYDVRVMPDVAPEHITPGTWKEVDQ